MNRVNILFYTFTLGDGKCVICDSYVRPCTLVRICDECNYGSYQGRCVICGGPGVSDAYYCKECTIMEKDVSISFKIMRNINRLNRLTFWYIFIAYKLLKQPLR